MCSLLFNKADLKSIQLYPCLLAPEKTVFFTVKDIAIGYKMEVTKAEMNISMNFLQV